MARPTVLLGPILHLDECSVARWNFRVNLLLGPGTGTNTELPPTDLIGFDDEDVVVESPRLLADFREHGFGRLWSWSVSVPRTDTDRALGYVVRGSSEHRVEHVAIPARQHLPRIAAFSCNGFSSSAERKKVAAPYPLWTRMLDLHQRAIEAPTAADPTGIHVLIGGGDQLYCDELDVVQEAFDRLDEHDDDLPDDFGTRAMREYLAHYVEHFGREPFAHLLERVPCALTWDDHEICDGFGSYRESMQRSEWLTHLYDAARRCFVAFQLGGDPDALVAPTVHRSETASGDDHLFQWLYLPCEGAEIDLLLLDLRSARTDRGVLSKGQWSTLRNALSGIARRTDDVKRHLLLVSSIPLVFAKHERIEHLIDLYPPKRELLDDLVDQWENEVHQIEQSDLLRRLFEHHTAGAGRVTILSGDVHSGTALELVDEAAPAKARVPILEIVTSGIVSPPPLTTLSRPLRRILMDADGRTIFDRVVGHLAPAMRREPLFLQRNFALIDFDPFAFDPATDEPRDTNFRAKISFELESSPRRTGFFVRV